jgi:two-component system cell cycle sensor histidine kinase/response regulator CckA
MTDTGTDEASEPSFDDVIYGVREGCVHAFENATLIVDDELVVRSANAAAARFMGCPDVAQVAGIDATRIVHADDRTRVRDQVRATRGTHDFVALNVAVTTNDDARPVEMRVVPLLTDGGEADGYMLTIPTLRQHDMVFRQLGRIAKVAAWIYDVMQDEFTFLVPESTPGDWTSIDLEDALRSPERRLDADAARQWRDAFDMAVGLGLEWNVMLTFLDANDHRRWLHTIGLAEMQTGVPVRLYGVVHDVTMMRDMQEQLLQSQKMEAVGQLAGGIAHDFNNILMAISSYRSLIEQTLPSSHEAQEDLDGLAQAVDSGAGLVRQLLALSRRQPTKPTVLDAGEVIRAMLTLLQRTIGSAVHVLVNVDAPLRKVLIDRSQLEQVVLNLAINARDAMPLGGTLTFELRNVTPRVTTSVGKAAQEHVEIVVRDTGTGIDAAMLAHIFEPFFTTKEPARGTGLGLPTSLGIVQRAGGFIDVSSRPGVGTVFRVCLPAVGDA